MPYDNWETMLEAERLRLSAPEVVYAWLAALPPSANTLEGNCADVVVKTLLDRDNPLINLGLARYTANYQLLSSLWDKGGLVRTALLANQAHGPLFPTSNFHSAGEPDQLGPLIEQMEVRDIQALYTNPLCPPSLLEQTFRNTLGLSPDRHYLACRFAVRNERLRETLGHDTFDEFTTSYEHAKPIHAVWDLIRTAPATAAWAQLLTDAGRVVFELGLPQDLTPDLKTDEGRADWNATWEKRNGAYRRLIFEAAQTRWQEPEDKRVDELNPWLWARAAFAEAVCRSQPHNPEINAHHPDRGFRKGFYSGAAVTPQWNVSDMYERDGEMFLDGIVWNNSLYERQNHNTQWKVRSFARNSRNDLYVSSLNSRLKALMTDDPIRYGDEPTDEMVEEMRKREERERAAEERLQRQRQAEATEAKPPQTKGWRFFG